MARKKRIILLNPNDFPIVTQMMNDISINDSSSSCYDYRGKQDKWIKASSNIGRISKKIGIEFLFPPSTSRSNCLGFMNIPPNIKLEKEPFGKQIKFIFTRKIF